MDIWVNRITNSNHFKAEKMKTPFNSTHLFTTICLFLFSLQLSRPSAFVKADATSFIQNLCSQTLELDACKKCVLSEPTKYIPELTYSVLFCMYSQAVYGHDHADELSWTARSPGVKQALVVCRDTLFAASNNLSNALSMMDGSKYRDAFVNMKNSRQSLISCSLAFRRFVAWDGDAIPTVLLDDMVLMKRLFDVGHYFFRLIIKINKR